MKTEDLKGHLLARSANLADAHTQLVANVLVAEERAKDLRRQLAANEGAQTENARILALIDPPATA